MLWSYFSFFTALCCFVGQSVWVIMVSGDTTAPLNCEYPSCQTTPPSSSRPLYGTPPPPPPSEPVYEAPPPPIPAPPSPTEPVYEAPPSPVGPPCQPPPPPSPAAPLYGMPPPPSPPGNCQPPMQNCVYTPPNTNTDVYQSIDSASDVPLYWLHILALLSLFFLPWLLC